ncbi:MAG: hypothetical protein QOH49_2256 [Acidobacteriota bacterium]|jgi:hypothetical protein|nr:hypothetical protein [Acidobacteriota bacterium]
MIFSPLRRLLPRLAALALCASALVGVAGARQQQAPLTNAEFLALVRQLPQRPGTKDQILSEIRRRGIGFTLTAGLRAFVATKSGNDAELKRVLEEAERRFLNPSEVKPLPPEAETLALLERARLATLEATMQMPDFVVKQFVTRSYAAGTSQNWHVSDRLIVGVSYRPSEGEKYRLLQVNGVTTPPASEKSDYKEAGGANSTGEFVSVLKTLFEEPSQTEFKPLDTDTLRGRRTVVYSYDIKHANSQWRLETESTAVIAAHHGKLWIDRERARVLRIEFESYDVPDTFPIRTAAVDLDYDWVTIPGQGEYLLPSRSISVLTTVHHGETQQARNEIRFRNYQKYGTELKILDDDILDEEVPKEEAPPPPKPPEKKP